MPACFTPTRGCPKRNGILGRCSFGKRARRNQLSLLHVEDIMDCRMRVARAIEDEIVARPNRVAQRAVGPGHSLDFINLLAAVGDERLSYKDSFQAVFRVYGE